MKKLLYLSLMLVIAGTFMSSTTTCNMERKDITVNIIFEEWHFQHDINGNNMGLIDSISVQLSGKNQSGESVEVKTSLYVGGAMYNPELMMALGKLSDGGELKNGNTGSGKLRLQIEYARDPNLFIERVGNMKTEKLEFNIPEEAVAVFRDAKDSNKQKKDIPVDIVFEEWHFKHDINGNNMGLIDSISVQLSGKNQSGEAVEVKTSLYVGGAMYNPELYRMLGKLGDGDETKNGNTGSGKLRLQIEYARSPNLFIERVGKMKTENMEFNIPEEAVAVFRG